MDAIDLLDGAVAELPRPRQDMPYGDRLSQALAAYVEEVNGLTGHDFAASEIRANSKRIRTLSDYLITAHRGALAGRLPQARAAMTSAMTLVAPELTMLRSIAIDQQALGPTFRLRIAPHSERVDRGDIFHVPFEKRHIVKPQRYSVLGLPMLYVGSTLFVCWEEMGRPSFDELWVTALRLRADKRVQVLDLGYRPALVAALLDKTRCSDTAATRLAVAHAILWPLTAACSFACRYDDAAYVEEYVIPQLVVSHLVETGAFDGVRYFSNRVSAYGGELLALNYVFPAQPSIPTGHCPRLVDLFELTPPMPWHMVRLLGLPIQPNNSQLTSRAGKLEVYAGHKIAYSNTEFAQIESLLLAQDFQQV